MGQAIRLLPFLLTKTPQKKKEKRVEKRLVQEVLLITPKRFEVAAMASDVDLSALERMVGKRLAGASRIVFEHAGSADVSRGALELCFRG